MKKGPGFAEKNGHHYVLDYYNKNFLLRTKFLVQEIKAVNLE